MLYSRMGKPRGFPTHWRSFTRMYLDEASTTDASYRGCARKLLCSLSICLYLLMLSFMYCSLNFEYEYVDKEFVSCYVLNYLLFDVPFRVCTCFCKMSESRASYIVIAIWIEDS